MEDEFDRIEREFDALKAPDDDDATDAKAQRPRHADTGTGNGTGTEAAADADAGPRPAYTAADSADMLDEEETFPSRSATEALVDHKLQQVAAYRATQADQEARRLLYEVLAEGNENQVRVARNILEQMDR